MENLGCPALRKLECSKDIVCTNHKDYSYSSVCAAKNVTMLEEWMHDNRKIDDVDNDYDEGDCGCNHAFNFSCSLFTNYL